MQEKTKAGVLQGSYPSFVFTGQALHPTALGNQDTTWKVLKFTCSSLRKMMLSTL